MNKPNFCLLFAVLLTILALKMIFCSRPNEDNETSSLSKPIEKIDRKVENNVDQSEKDYVVQGRTEVSFEE